MHAIVRSILDGTYRGQPVDGIDANYGVIVLKGPDCHPSFALGEATGVILYERFLSIIKQAAPKWHRRFYVDAGNPHEALSGKNGPGPIRSESAEALVAEPMQHQQHLRAGADRTLVRRLIEVLPHRTKPY